MNVMMYEDYLTIYTKPDCEACVNVKNYLDTKNFPYVALEVGRDVDREKLLEEGVKSVPAMSMTVAKDLRYFYDGPNDIYSFAHFCLSEVETIKEKMRAGEYNVRFIKKDGSIREMRCTLNPSLVPVEKWPKSVEEIVLEDGTKIFHDKSKRKRNNSLIIRTFDLDKQEWRSFSQLMVLGELV